MNTQTVTNESNMMASSDNTIDELYTDLELQKQKLLTLLQNSNLSNANLSKVEQSKPYQPDDLQGVDNGGQLSNDYKLDNEHRLNNEHRIDSEYRQALADLHNAQEAIIKAIIPNTSTTMTVYGAKQVVLDSLSYTVGSEVVKRSKSFSSALTLPIFIIEKYKVLKASTIQDLDITLDLSSYVDYMDAERPKNHLSYKLGLSLVTSAKENKGWWLMFSQLYQVIKKFRK